MGGEGWKKMEVCLAKLGLALTAKGGSNMSWSLSLKAVARLPLSQQICVQMGV